MGGRVLIVDDSAFMRIALRHIIESESGLLVVGEARGGADAVSMARTLAPDIVTMDVEMAGMDGLAATRAILSGPPPHPRIIMVSNHTQEGTAATVEALHAGAVDWVSKSSGMVAQDLAHVDTQLRSKLLFWSRRPGAAPAVPAGTEPPPPVPWTGSGAVDLIVVGVSTGGPKVLGDFLAAAGRLVVPMVIAQHMPARYTASLAEILRNETGLDVTEGAHRTRLGPGAVVFIPGGTDGMVAPHAGPDAKLELRLSRTDASVHPNANLLFGSAVLVARNPVAVILTGMGEDGVEGAKRFKRRGFPVLVQRPASCIVDGMPAAAIAAGVATEALGVAAIGHRLAAWVGASAASVVSRGHSPGEHQ